MSVSNPRERSLYLAARLYGTLLIAYLATLRSEFSGQLVQVSRDASRHSQPEGRRGLLRIWLYTLVDLITPVSAERRSDRHAWNGLGTPYFCMAALILSLVTGYLHLRAGVDVLSVAILLGGGCLFGLAHPKGALRFTLKLGLGIPAALFVGHSEVASPVPRRDADLPLPAAFIPAMLGGYTGVFAHRMFPRLARSLRFGRQGLY